jgi:hypothetical protein
MNRTDHTQPIVPTFSRCAAQIWLIGQAVVKLPGKPVVDWRLGDIPDVVKGVFAKGIVFAGGLGIAS